MTLDINNFRPSLADGQSAALERHIRLSQRHEAPWNLFDGQLLDVINAEMTRVPERRKVMNTLVSAAKDERITKQFYHLNVMKEKLALFCDDEVLSKKIGRKRPKPFFWNKSYKGAYSFIERILHDKVDKLEPLDAFSTELQFSDIFSNPNGSMGYTMPGGKKKDYWDLILENGRSTLKSMSKPNPDIAYHRAQISGYVKEDGTLSAGDINYSDRLIWCSDATVIFVEGLFVRPLMENVFQNCENYAGGKSARYISNKFRSWNRFHWLSLDYSTFDATIPDWLIHDAFNLIRSFFDRKHWKTLFWIENHFIHTEMVDFSGVVVQKHRGIPSGSYFTQIIGSLCNMLMMMTYEFHRFDNDLSKVKWDIINKRSITFMVMGDDNIVFTKIAMKKEEFAHYVLVNFGVKVNDTKSSSGTSYDKPEFLKRFWGSDGSERNIYELLINAIHPERPREYEKKGFSPYHVLYGYFLVYNGTMRRYFSERFIIKGMHDNGGIEGLNRMSLQDMPGSLRTIKTEHRYLWDRMMERLETLSAALH